MSPCCEVGTQMICRYRLAIMQDAVCACAGVVAHKCLFGVCVCVCGVHAGSGFVLCWVLCWVFQVGGEVNKAGGGLAAAGGWACSGRMYI
jgi:hypothetical protein